MSNFSKATGYFKDKLDHQNFTAELSLTEC